MKNIRYLMVFLLFLIAPLCPMAYANKIIPGGENIGIEINSKGVLVVGFYKVDGEYNKGIPDINIGDYIIKVNNQEVNTISDLVTSIDHEIKNNKVVLEVIRDKQVIKIDFEVKEEKGVYKTGLYVKDKISGIGTITYIDPESKVYGALGHEMVNWRCDYKYEDKLCKSKLNNENS